MTTAAGITISVGPVSKCLNTTVSRYEVFSDSNGTCVQVLNIELPDGGYLRVPVM